MRILGLLLLVVATQTAAEDGPWVRSVQAPVYFAVDVGDVDAAVNWYRTVFGVEVVDDTTAEDGRWRIANLGSDDVAIEIIFDRRSSTVEEQARYRGFAKVGVAVPDVALVADRVEQATGNRPRVLDFPRHGIRLIQLHDPEGNIVQLHSPVEPTESGGVIVAGKYGKKLDAIMTAYHVAGMFQGAVLIALDDEVIFRKAFGRANIEWEIPNTVETSFTIASLGKAFTAAIILQLVDEGKLALGDPVSKHLSSYRKDLGAKITIDHLLAHTAGIPWPQDAWPPEKYTVRYELAELVELCNQGELKFEPGSEFSYCNSCYHLAAAIIEEKTGNSFEHELRSRLLEPLGMNHTGIAYSTPLIPRRARGYDILADGSFENTLLEDQSYAVGAGGMYSTVDDLYKWDRALYGDLLSPSSREAMFTPGLNGSGYGWAIGKYGRQDSDELGSLALGYGGTTGFASGMARLFDDRYFIVFLGNMRQIPQNRLMNDLWNTILGLEVDPAAIGKE